MFVSRGQTALAEASESGGGSSLIVYNGAMVDVGSIMQKLDKSEKAREEIEQKLMVQDSKMGKRQVTSTDLLNSLHGHWDIGQYELPLLTILGIILGLAPR